MWWVKDNDQIWHCCPTFSKFAYRHAYLPCEEDSKLRRLHEIIEQEYGSKNIITACFADSPHQICDVCWHLFEQSDDWDTRYIAKARDAKTERQKIEAEKQEKARIQAAKRAEGRTEVVIDRIITVRDTEAGEHFSYHIFATAKDRRGFPDVLDISRYDVLGRTMFGLFVGDKYTWIRYEYEILNVQSVEEWLRTGHAPYNEPSKEFMNTKSGLAGNPTYRRR